MNHFGKELPKTMLILKSHPSGLAATEAFLSNRGWHIFSTADVKEALTAIVSQRYSYILFSVDHSNSKIQMLPRLIRSKFNAVVVAFAESRAATSYQLLNEIETEYKIYAPVTGPAIERCVQKVLKDRQLPMPVQVRDYVRPIGSPGASDRARFFRGEKLGGQLILLQPMRPQRPLAGVFVTAQRQFRDFGSLHVRKPRKNWWDNLEQEVDLKTPHGRVFEKQFRNKYNETLIARATYRSLIGNVDILDGTVRQKVEETTNSSCILVESDRFSGYLVAALGRDLPIEDRFIKGVQQSLFRFLKDNGEHVSEQDVLNLKLKKVDFDSWALDYADFLKTSVHQGNEVAMAFFPRKPLGVRLEDSVHPDMLKVNIKDLQGDRKVEFDLYLYFEANQKYILYTPKGGIFYTRQLERLTKQGVTHMHLQLDAIKALEKYHAQNYLNDLIDSFEEAQPLSEKAAAA